MRLSYHVVDVFTQTRFGGNPLAVVLDADDLTTAQMQAIAREFNYSETTFVLRPKTAGHSAHVRIFTPVAEIPFAGHPNVGTAFIMATLDPNLDELVFEERAGLVSIRILRDAGAVGEVRLTAPETLSVRRSFSPSDVAACLSLSPEDIALGVHEPRVASVGLPFLVVEIASRDALSRARPDKEAFTRILPADGADAIYLYCRERNEADGAVDFSARMFAPFDGVAEDPATGSATAATCAMLAAIDASAPRRFEVAQGIDMGRPSRLTIELDEQGSVWIGGTCVAVMRGELLY